MQSCLYYGWVRHRRFRPTPHTFSYALFFTYLDLAELPALFKGRWLWSSERFTLAQFRRSDHFGDPQAPLDQSIRELVEQRLSRRPQGPIRLLTHLRYFGYCFNPVSFYYCYDAAAQCVETIIAEVNNTPWGEQHCYVLGEQLNQGTVDKKHYRFGKTFHVSPFMEMELDYDWRFRAPGRQLVIHMENLKAGRKFFDATMTLTRREISTAMLTHALVRYPLVTGKVIAAIYWQAFRLWLKKTPVYEHPGTQLTSGKTQRP